MKSNLLELVKDNPDLPIYALVHGEVCEDDCHYFFGELGQAEIREYANVEQYGYYDMTVVFKDDDEDYFEHLINSDEYEDLSQKEAEKKANEEIDKLNWKKAIFVYVGLPNM